MTNYYNYQTSATDYDECITRGICSVNSTLTSVQEVILLYLKELSFYLLKLKPFGITNDTIKSIILETFFNILTNAEYDQEVFQDLIENLYDFIQQSKILYEKTCLEKNIEIETTKSYFKYSKNFSLTDAIRKGEKYFLKKVHSFAPREKDYYDIVLFLLKSFCIKIVELQRLGTDLDEAYYEMLHLLNLSGTKPFDEEEIKNQIESSIEFYYNLVKKVFYTQAEQYGKIRQTKVSFSAQKGNAILVSGTDFKKLENVLKACEGTEIGVYTHGLEMLMAHAFPKMQAHPNLKGHFGAGLDCSLVDFASFPGAILLTKGSLQKVEFLYRGRLFSLDPISPHGVVKIVDNNYEPLIKSALEAKGFVTEEKKPMMDVGFNEEEINKMVDDIAEKMINKKLKNLIFVGLLNAPNLAYKEYFQNFLSLLKQDSFVISMCCPVSGEFIFHLESFYDYSLFYTIIKRLREKINLAEHNITVFVTRCDKHILANLIYLKKIGIKNIYTCKCHPSLVSPNLLETLKESFGVKEISNVQNDFREIMSSNE